MYPSLKGGHTQAKAGYTNRAVGYDMPATAAPQGAGTGVGTDFEVAAAHVCFRGAVAAPQ